MKAKTASWASPVVAMGVMLLDIVGRILLESVGSPEFVHVQHIQKPFFFWHDRDFGSRWQPTRPKQGWTTMRLRELGSKEAQGSNLAQQPTDLVIWLELQPKFGRCYVAQQSQNRLTGVASNMA